MMTLIIIGPAGAGKTFLANRLKEKYNVSVYSTDSIVFNINGSTKDKVIHVKKTAELEKAITALI